MPQFGWVVNDPDRGEVQTAYEIVVREPTIAGTRGQDRVGQRRGAVEPAVVRDARRISRSIPTAPTRGRFARGITSDASGPYSRRRPISTSACATRTGAPTGSAGPGAEHALPEDFSLFRKEATITPSPIVRARAYVSAGQQFDLRVNGVRVAHGPSFSYPDEQYYEATDITKQLVAGRLNTFGVITHFETPGQGRPASVPGLIARITVDHADGTRQVITTDGELAGAAGPVGHRQAPQRRRQLGRAHRRPAQPGRLGPHRLPRPQLGRARDHRRRIPSRRSCTSSRSAVTSSSRRCSRSRSSGWPTVRTSPTSAR